jgi:hypothetical protein
MQNLHRGHRSSGRALRQPSASLQGPRQFALQIDAALRLAPADGFRGSSAVLLSCGEPAELCQVENALRSLWPLDAVHPLPLPIRSWEEALGGRPGTESWLQHYVMREVHERGPSLVAILDRSPTGRSGDVQDSRPLVGMLRQWGSKSPVAVLRTCGGEDVEWVVAPAAVPRWGDAIRPR